VSRWRFLWPWWLALSTLAAGTGAAAQPLDPEAVRLREQGASLILRDDAASLARALELFGAAARAEPRLYQARADGALVQLLRAAALRDEATRLAAWEEPMRMGREMREGALEELRPLVREHAGDLAVTRALAIYYGLDGNEEQVAALAERARAAGSRDPWIDFAELAARVRNAGAEAAIPMLAAFAASHPDASRVRMMLARKLFDIGRADEALAALDDLLAANPEHDGAKRLKATLLAPPPARMQVLPAPLDLPPPQPPGTLPRKAQGAR
jgi:predicted Zn-dependent protease